MIEAATEKKEDDHDHKVWLIWHLALLNRWNPKKALPKLGDFLSGKRDKKKVASNPGNDIMAGLREYQKKRDKTKASKK